ncbi:hypothetical protein JQ607_23325 [Bradyrhizobium liaoningense]|uniref:hypothetical protein n=1 Tax=Bradyrhizobium liaoningense TaxID=43992 RepID=UPI001BA68697|nr:hypothetical protein [Bradyrhizobium liaoningense]MBR0843142.1 hypothetical protein [Bradyrhizobium liaoningense]
MADSEMSAEQVGRQYIFALAGPLIGWVVFCVVLGLPGLLVFGTLVGLPFIYLFGLPPAVLIYCVDREMIDRSLPLWSRSIACLLLGGLLSIGLFYLVPLPLGLHSPGTLLGSLPGAVSAFVCVCWGGK